eukprot:gnl/Spiro4/14142_TR7597_c0_g1_i1.p1 gnl/Spiro4/14142_TR7597_c0_g1~~gnl/Spiro4/14142_TR7597_c0_g1_i1.p1  ORF type:complete len:449 (-),score=129.83 gnl/Spiro4/14142_TR7597_c0_g1_i1:36-1382(-)
MKYKTLTRSKSEYVRTTNRDLLRVHRNPDPSLHPFERAREYTRALNAVKLDRVFAKPFVFALSGHRDAVSCMAKSATSLIHLASGAANGELKLWNLPTQRQIFSVERAHTGFVRGVGFHHTGRHIFSCGTDMKVHMWPVPLAESDAPAPEAVNTWMGRSPFNALDHSYKQNLFCTAGGSGLEVWDENRSDPMHHFELSTESLRACRFNAAQIDLIAAAGSERHVVFYDLRVQSAVRQLVLRMCSNDLCFNPMEPFNLLIANEDHNLYTFDIRKLDRALCVHEDHVSAVMSCDFAPTGRMFVSGSYDRSIRLFNMDGGHSHDVYHTSRMQRVFSVLFSPDAQYVLSASDDTNIRIWKAKASKSLKTTNPREERSNNYNEVLKERYSYLPELRRIARHRHVPKAIRQATQQKRVMRNARLQKIKNQRAHSAPGSVTLIPERQAHVVAQKL